MELLGKAIMWQSKTDWDRIYFVTRVFQYRKREGGYIAERKENFKQENGQLICKR